MKKFTKVAIILVFVGLIICTKTLAHGGNITGWKDKNSKEIVEHEGKFYGYHNENKVRHFHQVEWRENEQKWVITKTAVYYDENFNIINNNVSNAEKLEVKFSVSVDGDTAKFELDGKIITVRFLGINTPETVDPNREVEAFGKEASDYTKNALKNATKIEIELDSKAGEKDKYDRTLAWVFVDGKLLQEEIVKNGLAEQYMLLSTYKYAGEIQEAEEIAKNAKVGMWENAVDTKKKTDKTEANTIEENVITEEPIFILIVVAVFCIISIIFKKGKKK